MSALEVATSLCALTRGASIEIDPRQLQTMPLGLPPGTQTYVPFLPQAAWRETVAACVHLRRLGMVPVPHLTARGVASAGQLDAMLGELAAAGVDRLLLIAGDCATPAGPYASTMALLESGKLARHGFRRFGIAAHPEGHPHVPRRELEAALAEKVEYARGTGAKVWVVTQFAFAHEPMLAFLRHMGAAHPGVPVRIGIPGPARLRTLLAFAARCGVGVSAKQLARRPGALRLLGRWSPNDVVAKLAEHAAGAPDSPLAGIHVFAFGGIDAAVRWLHSLHGAKTAPEAA